MTPMPIVMGGTLKADGTLELDEKPTLPPGRVQVTLTLPPQPEHGKEDTMAVLERIWRDREARGEKPRSAEEIDAEVNALRDDLEEHANMIERLQEEAQRAREKPPC